MRAAINGTNYVPLDEIESMPRVRVLRALKHFDWVSARDLMEAIGVYERHTASSFTAVIAQLVAEELVDRSGEYATALYRVDARGIAYLETILKRALVSENTGRAYRPRCS